MKKIAVLLSAYNGDEYIEEQIESIYHQKGVDVRLFVRDDGSTDIFVKKLKMLQRIYHFTLIEGENVGFLKSFFVLLRTVENADLYAFADQDDIWMADKLLTAQEWFLENGKSDIPQLYHSAYDIIDTKDSNRIGHFYFLNDDYDFRRSITENHYSGFSMVINATLREYMLLGDWERIGYHDWWAAMIVQAFGEGYFDNKVLALHRAHGGNVTTFNMKTRLQWLKKSLCEESDIHKRAVEFERCFGKKISDLDAQMLKMFCMKGYHLGYALKKCFYPKRWRPVLSSEIVMRFLMLVGKV